MTRLRRLFQPVNWTYALGEICLIVIGVLLALGINNWNEGRLDRRAELALLRQIRAELRADSADVHGNVELLRRSRASALRLRDHLEQDLPYHDSLSVAFGVLRVSVVHRLNTAAYQTLRAKGLDLVSNDSLRLAITQLYDGDYGFAAKLDGVSGAFIDRTHPILSRRFRQDELFGPAAPRDYAALAHDQEFMGLLDEYIGRFSWTQPPEEALARSINELARAIDREITAATN